MNPRSRKTYNKGFGKAAPSGSAGRKSRSRCSLFGIHGKFLENLPWNLWISRRIRLNRAILNLQQVYFILLQSRGREIAIGYRATRSLRQRTTDPVIARV